MPDPVGIGVFRLIAPSFQTLPRAARENDAVIETSDKKQAVIGCKANSIHRVITWLYCLEIPIRIEDLDTVVLTVRDIKAFFVIKSQGMRRMELAICRAPGSPRAHKITTL